MAEVSYQNTFLDMNFDSCDSVSSKKMDITVKMKKISIQDKIGGIVISNN